MTALGPAVLGAISIATSECDSLIEGLAAHLPSQVAIRPYGLLDGLGDEEAIAAFGRDDGQRGIVSHTASGREILVAHEKILSGVCRLVARAEDDGAFATVVLCGAGWADVPRRRPLVDPGALFPANIRALAGSQRLGIIKPSAGQIDYERARYTAWGHDVAVTSASAFAGGADDFRRAARELRAAGAELIWMTCVGFEDEYRMVVAEETGVPVILARPLLGRILAEVMATAGMPSGARA